MYGETIGSRGRSESVVVVSERSRGGAILLYVCIQKGQMRRMDIRRECEMAEDEAFLYEIEEIIEIHSGKLIV